MCEVSRVEDTLKPVRLSCLAKFDAVPFTTTVILFLLFSETQTDSMGRGDVITQTSFAVSPGKTSTKRVSFQCQVGEGGADVSRDVRGSGSGRVSVDVRVKQRQLACDDDDMSSFDDTTSSQTSSSCESDLPKVIGRVNTRFWEDQQKSASTVSGSLGTTNGSGQCTMDD